jgi:hypothetical protein
MLANKNKILGINSPIALYREHSEGERIGKPGNNDQKLKTILELRKVFMNTLRKEGLLNEENKKALAEFCFYFWMEYRKLKPKMAEDFYKLSRELNNKIAIKGGLVYQLISKIFGVKNAVIIKSLLK